MPASQYQGVYWHGSVGRWFVAVQDGPKQRHMGYFVSEEEAARAYDAVVSQSRDHGMAVNFLPDGSPNPDRLPRYVAVRECVHQGSG